MSVPGTAQANGPRGVEGAEPVEINCHIPVTVRVVGVPTDEQLQHIGRAVTRLVRGRAMLVAKRAPERRAEHAVSYHGGHRRVLCAIQR